MNVTINIYGDVHIHCDCCNECGVYANDLEESPEAPYEDAPDTEDGSEVCTLPGGEEVNFYQVIPLYRDELEYKLAHDAETLLDKMDGISFVVEPDRQDAITRGTLSNDDFDGEMDDASYHLESIEEKELPIDPINAYNHMAIYLRWCMEHDLMGEDFLKEYSEVAKQVKADPASVDLRAFIRDELDGCSVLCAVQSARPCLCRLLLRRGRQSLLSCRH